MIKYILVYITFAGPQAYAVGLTVLILNSTQYTIKIFGVS